MKHQDTFSNLMTQFSAEHAQKTAAEERARHRAEIFSKIRRTLLLLLLLGGIGAGAYFGKDRLSAMLQPAEKPDLGANGKAKVLKIQATADKNAKIVDELTQ